MQSDMKYILQQSFSNMWNSRQGFAATFFMHKAPQFQPNNFVQLALQLLQLKHS